ncbi:MAG TPA: hypothetical protein VF132_08525 [Rudaea sp.]
MTAFAFVNHWPQGTPKDGHAVLEFWRSEKAIGDEAQAQERLRQVILHAIAPSGDVAAVCTAVPITLPRLGQPMYYYRSFVGKAWRGSLLALQMLRRAQDTLQAHARANDYPCIGILLELENAMFDKKMRVPVWPSTGFVYIGKSQRNLDLRVWYFPDAPLKDTPAK